MESELFCADQEKGIAEGTKGEKGAQEKEEPEITVQVS